MTRNGSWRSLSGPRAWILAVLVASTFATLDTGTGAVAEIRAATGYVIGPLQQATATLADAGLDGSELAMLRADRDRLALENAALRARRPVEADADRAGGPTGAISARAIGLGPALSYAETVTIDAGRADGVRPDAVVVAPEGLVGRVLRAERTTAVVLLAVDPASTVGARIAGNRELGLLRGDRLTMLDAQAGVEVGDQVVSWGSPDGHRYPPDLPLGTVEAVGTGRSAGRPDTASGLLAVTVRPAVKPSTIDRVAVLADPAPAGASPRDLNGELSGEVSGANPDESTTGGTDRWGW